MANLGGGSLLGEDDHLTVAAWTRIGTWALGLGLLAGCGAAASVPASSPAPGASTARTSTAGAAATPASGAARPAGSPVSGTFTIGGPSSTASYTAHETFLRQNSPFTPVGKTSAVSGTLVLAAGRFKASTVQVGLQTLKTDNATRDRHVQSTLDTAKFPDATFAITGEQAGSAAVDTGGTADVRLTGNMTIDGTQKPVVWDAKAQVSGNTLHLTATTSFNMSLFGVTPPSIPGFVAVKDGIELGADLTASKA